MSDLRIRLLEERDIAPIVSAFLGIGSDTKPESLYQRYLSEQTAGQRAALVACLGGRFTGYLTVQWQSNYPPFRQDRIPEITDFNVLPDFRRRGIGTALLDEAERRIAERSPIAGIGVGMPPEYGAAHRLYVLRGYVPDGSGLFRRGHHAGYGDQVTVDDDLVIYFTKELK